MGVPLYKLRNLITSVIWKGLFIPENRAVDYQVSILEGYVWGGRHQGVVVTVYTACVSTRLFRMSREKTGDRYAVGSSGDFVLLAFTSSWINPKNSAKKINK